MRREQFLKCAGAALGTEQADLVLKGGRVVDVFSGRILEADVAIRDGVIVGVGENYAGETEIQLGGKYVAPGFLDAHLHLESTMVSPAELVATAVRFGTTTFVVDPHEAANVAGAAGIDYILDQTADSHANVYVMMPSCVPATAIDDNGCTFTAADMRPYLDNPRILGLGEVMDDPAVIRGDPDMFEKLRLFEGRVIDGHAPGLTGRELSAYAMAGVATDHEAITYEYAMEEVRRGIHVHIREGSAAHNCADILRGVVRDGVDTGCFSFCTDDKHIEDILRDGHISHNVRIAVELGLSPVRAIQMATINTARLYGLKHLGAVAPGRQADLVILSDLESVTVEAVYYRGRLVDPAEEGRPRPCPEALRHTVHLDPVTAADFALPVRGPATHVIALDPRQITTTDLKMPLPPEENFTPRAGYEKVAAVERHKNTGKIGVAVAAGYGIRGGAIASSVSHDSHNIIVIGDNDRDMALAVNELIRVQGGYTVVAAGEVYETLPLPIMGLMSDAGFGTVNETLARMKRKARELGVPPEIDPFITLSFLALPVIPTLRITPRGLYRLDETGLHPVEGA